MQISPNCRSFGAKPPEELNVKIIVNPCQPLWRDYFLGVLHQFVKKIRALLSLEVEVFKLINKRERESCAT